MSPSVETNLLGIMSNQTFIADSSALLLSQLKVISRLILDFENISDTFNCSQKIQGITGHYLTNYSIVRILITFHTGAQSPQRVTVTRVLE